MNNLKKIILMMMILAVSLSMLAGCAKQDESALAGELVGGAQDSFTDFGDSDQPQQDQSSSDSIEQEEQDSSDAPSAENKPSVDTPQEQAPSQDIPEEEKEEEQQSPSQEQEQEPSEEEEQPAEKQEELPITPEDPDAEGSGWYKIASYNIKSMWYDPQTKMTGFDQKDKIARILREIDADIVGLQEIDDNTKRTGYIRQTEWLARELDYDYYYFTRTVNKGDGDYGHAILSRFPIKMVEEVDFKSQRGEHRKYTRALLEIDGKDVAFYNNHFCTQEKLADGSRDSSAGQAQFNEVGSRFQKEKIPALMTGDFNLPIQTQFRLYNRSKITSMNGGKTQTKLHKEISIDNIYVNNLVEYYVDKEGMSVFVGAETASDHDPLWSYFKLK